MKFDHKYIKLLSTIGPRASLGLFLLEFIKKKKNLMVVTSDVSTSAGLDRFRKLHSQNFIDVGIAEQNLIGVSTGLASEGFDVLTTTFAPFQTLRCCEQIKVNLGYMKQKVTMVGLASGLVLGNLGYTHCSIEEMSIMRSIPNITVISPSDSLETIKAVEQSFNHKNSVYIRLTGSNNNPIINNNDYKFKIGKCIQLEEGNDVVIFACGSILNEVLKASKILKKKGINSNIINVHTIKPIDKKYIIEKTKGKKLIISVEEHNILGGLGSAIAECLSEQVNTAKHIMIGINDKYSNGGDYSYLLNHYGLTSKKIANKILKNFLL